MLYSNHHSLTILYETKSLHHISNEKKRVNKQPLRFRYIYDTTLTSFYENIFDRTTFFLSLKDLLRLATFK